jgi:enoyl-CoA hydratase/carnithine racemase
MTDSDWPKVGEENDVDYSERCYETKDFEEGVTTFLEKRKPHFEGR